MTTERSPADRAALVAHQEALRACRRCPGVCPPGITGQPVPAEVYLLGQAPGPHEGRIGRPFGWTAGRTLFRWLASVGPDEATVRERVWFAAVLRCFPGKAATGGGDRVPAPEEIARCRGWIAAEVELLRPTLVIAVGRLAIEQVAGGPVRRLDTVVGPLHRGTLTGHPVDWVALPHPSGLSAWPKVEPGRTLLARALETLASHPAWRRSVLGAPDA